MKKVLSKSLPILVTGALLAPLAAQAVPSFARQTGFSCAMCHTVWPQLTPYGRMFKLGAYSTATGQFNAQSEQHKNLQEDTSAPIALMLQVSYMDQKASKVSSTTSGATSSEVEFPQQYSFFYAGRISDDMGMMSQITFDDGGTFGMDNTDIRFAGKSSDGSVLWGWSMNNVPGVEDLWNSTPVWGWPADHAPGTASPAGGIGGANLIGGGDMAGVTAFAMVNNSMYGEVGMYHSTNGNVNGGGTLVNADHLDGWAPYVRVAYQKDLSSTSNFEVGLTDMSGTLWTATGNSSATYTMADLGIDGQYQYINGPTTATVRAMYTTEDSKATGTSVKTHELNLNGSYYMNRMYGITAIYDATGGDTSAAAGTTGGVTSLTVQANYLPYLNTKFAIAYTDYTSMPTQAAGVSKGDFNTLYLLAWYMI